MTVHSWVGYAILALVLWGITGVTQKLSTNRISSERSFLWFGWAMVALSAAVLVLVHPQMTTAPLVIICSIIGGSLNGAGAWTSFRALEAGGKASIVISLVSLYPLLTIFLAVVILRERLGPTQIVGAVIAIAAAILLSIETASNPAS